MQLNKRLKKHWADIFLGDFTPHNIALGLALGTFLALLPTFGFGLLIAIGIIFLYPHINKPATIFAFILWNPLTQIPIYILSIHLGGILFEGVPVVKYDIEILNQIYTFTRRFLIAHIIVSFACSLIMYASIRGLLKIKL